MNVPLISIIIPTYNRRYLLKIVLDSIYAQSEKDYEVIIVDDGSNDGTDEFIRVYPDVKYTKVLNGGVSKARNTGLRMAKGKFVAFFDSDDYWDPDKLELQLEEFKKNPDLVMVYTNFRNIDDQNKVIRDPVINIPTNIVSIDSSLKEIIEGTLACFTSTVMIRRSIFDKIGYFDEHYSIAEDFDLWIRVALIGRVCFIVRPTISLRLHQNHLSRSLRSEVWKPFISVIQKHASELLEHDLFPRKYIAKFSLLTANAFLKEDHRFLSLKYLIYAMFNDPVNGAVYKGITKCILPVQFSRGRMISGNGQDQILKEYY